MVILMPLRMMEFLLERMQKKIGAKNNLKFLQNLILIEEKHGILK
jgi:hypothetical protein